MYWSLNFLAVVFKKARDFTASSHQNAGVLICVFTNFPGVIPPDPHSGTERPSTAPNTQPGFWLGPGRKRPGVGTQTLVPLNFSAAGRQKCRTCICIHNVSQIGPPFYVLHPLISGVFRILGAWIFANFLMTIFSCQSYTNGRNALRYFPESQNATFIGMFQTYAILCINLWLLSLEGGAGCSWIRHYFYCCLEYSAA